MSKDKTNQKGITLIALVITIIVMLILVGVSVSVALNGGLFDTAKEAAEGTATRRNEELELSSGKVEINGEWYNSIDEYVNGSGNETGGQKVALTPKKETYTIGEPVTIGEENFYVIADDTEKVTLLAKDNINTSTFVQDASAGTVTFSSTNYWSSDVISNSYEYDLTETGEPDASHYAARAAYDYGTKVGGTGRLMALEEARALQSTNSDILHGTNGKSSGTYLNYWLGCANSTTAVWRVEGELGEFIGDGISIGNYTSSIFGVRPVVEISKANIS